MATTLTDFAEQANPKTLAEARRAGFKQATRIHGSFLATAEKRTLVWMAERMPRWVNSDHLTVLGFAAQIATGICYALAGRDQRMLLAAIVCLADTGWMLSTHARNARWPMTNRGAHGFDPYDPAMAAVFVAAGPAFKPGVVLPVFDNVDVYPLLARLIGVTPQPNDGTLGPLVPALAP